MSSMDFNFGMEDVNLVVLQELLNRVAFRSIELVSETRDAVLEKKSFQEFSRSIYDIHALLQALDVRKIGAAMGSEFTKARLEELDAQLRKAGEIIQDYKSGSRLRLLLHSHSLLSRMQDLAREIAATISSFQLVNLDMALNLKTKTNQIINSLESMEFQSAVATETIAWEIENSISQNSRNREHSVKLLEKIAEAVGASSNVSLIRNELAILKQEKEEMDAAKKEAEAFQLSQLIQLLLSTEMVTRPQPQNEEPATTYHPQYPIESLICPLCNELMTDPVAISCGHSFERKAIQEHLEGGGKNCPTCGDKLSSLLLTPNISLRSSIEEWKQRQMELTFQAAISEINSGDHTGQNRALEHLQSLIHIPKYAEKAAEQGLIQKLVEFLKDNNRLNIKATLKCLYCLAKYSDTHKEAIAEARAVRHIVKQIYKGETESDAMAILLELSKIETVREKIGRTKDCIPVLVSLLRNDKPSVSQKAQTVLQNLSSNTHFAVKMAEAGYFPPFVACFNQGAQETRALMSAALIKMELKETNIKDLKDKQFIHNMIQMLSSNNPGCKLTCLTCIKKLIAYPKIVKRLLSDTVTIPLLLGLVSFVRSELHYKQEAAEILALMVEACQYPQFQLYQGLQELQSEHNINLFLQLVASSEPEMKIQFLHLLVELSYKCEKARNLIQSNGEAITHLFASLESDQQAVRKWALKLIHCTSDGYPDGVPLPPTPHKEAAVNTLATILTCSPDSDERSIAAAIISQLPKEDNVVDEALRKSEALKAIHEVICCTDDEFIRIKSSASQNTSLLENALAALLRFTEPTKPELQRQVGKLELYPSLVRVLSTGSSTAKQRTAIALAQLSQSSSLSVSDAKNTMAEQTNSMPMLQMMRLVPNISSWCCSASVANPVCSVHGSACSARETFCLVKADAVKPLVQTLSDKESGVAEAALMALETLLMDHSTLSHAIAVIVDSQGVTAILQVLEKGSLSAKSKALDLLQKILNHTQIGDRDPLFLRSETILIQLLEEDALRKKVALVLRQMGVIPEQSSYF